MNEIIHNEMVALSKTPGFCAPSAPGEHGEETEEHMQRGGVVEACMSRSRALGKGAKKKHVEKKNNMDGVLVDVHNPPLPAPGSVAGGDRAPEWGAPPH